MKVYDDYLMEVYYHADTNIIVHIWKGTSADLTDELFKEQLVKFREIIVKHKAKGVAADTTHFLFAMTPEVQDWVVSDFFGVIIPAGLRKYGLTVSRDTLTQLSVEQVVDDEKSEEFTTRYFDDFEACKAWVAK